MTTVRSRHTWKRASICSFLATASASGKRVACRLQVNSWNVKFRSMFALHVWMQQRGSCTNGHLVIMNGFCLLLSCHQFDCCGVNSPEDFKDSLFRLINPNHAVPEACCQRASQAGELASISKEQCLTGNMMFRNNKVTSGSFLNVSSPRCLLPNHLQA